jgi:Tol biopolymer transport system component
VIPLGQHQVLETGRNDASPLTFAPDGSSVVYAAREDGRSRLFLRRLDAFEASPIPDTEDARYPFFSPDGAWIGFAGARGVFKVPVQGGSRAEIASTNALRAAWGDDGSVVLEGRASDAGLWRVPETGGDPIRLTTTDPDNDEERHALPEMLPGSSGLLFTLQASNVSRIAALSFETGEWRILEELGEGGGPHYLRTGHVVYGQRGRLMAAPFDPSRFEVLSAPAPVIDGVSSFTVSGLERPLYAVSNAGHLAYVPGAAALSRRLVWVDRNGRETEARAQAAPYEYPSLSPEGNRILYTLHDEEHDAWKSTT